MRGLGLLPSTQLLAQPAPVLSQVVDTQTVAQVKAAAAAQTINPTAVQQQIATATEQKLAAQGGTDVPLFRVGPLAPAPGAGAAATPADAAAEAAVVEDARAPVSFMQRHGMHLLIAAGAGLAGLFLGRAIARR